MGSKWRTVGLARGGQWRLQGQDSGGNKGITVG